MNNIYALKLKLSSKFEVIRCLKKSSDVWVFNLSFYHSLKMYYLKR